MTEKPTRQEHEEAIRARAHDYWEKEGQPDSRHLEHWLKAEEELGQLDPQTKGADGAEMHRREEANNAHANSREPEQHRKGTKAN
jgi:hypothetical protein